ncbi:hypothetical protein [Deinococcus radiophilus]|uniref:hypothetical protein n=1 Tax=Deinococcus radiophilus TaxID=32062 RepID=UPI0036142434
MSEIRIPILDLKPEIDELRPELLAAIERVLDRTDFIMGEDVGPLRRKWPSTWASSTPLG